MKDYRRGSHSVFQIHLHMVWCTKYRKKVLEKDIGERLREICRQICSDMSVEILSGVVAKDHVHVLVSIPPQVSVSKLIQKLKGKSSYKLQREYSSLRKQYWGQRMWARGYFACSTGNITDDMIKAYIENHVERDDEFHVE
ncbi:MAG: IS200/IS605 family transposase [Mariprofundaceae bacterium]|nr:IS200/IS605 family transposase [Mariprofundaceae bacterium]